MIFEHRIIGPLVALALTLIAALVAPLARAEEMALAGQPARIEVTLKPGLSVEGSTIRLGDLFNVADGRAELALLRAPEPGHKLAISARELQAFAARHGVLWYNAEKLGEVVVARASQIIREDAVRYAIASELTMRGHGPDLAIRLQTRRLEIHVPTDVSPEVHVTHLDFNPATELFDAVIEVPTGEEAARRVHIQGRAYPMMRLPVLARSIGREEIITAADIALVEVPSGRLSPMVVTTTDDLVGKAARRPLAANQPIQSGDVGSPIIVRKNAVVTMVYQVPGMVVSDVGRALANAALGESVDVTNPRSNVTVRAIVTGPGRVMLDPKPIVVAVDRQ